jgi:hypothetical protein
LTIRYLKTKGKNITRWQTSWLVTAKSTIRPSGVPLTPINHQQNAASGRSYPSSDEATLQYIDYPYFVNNDDSIT